MATGLRLGSAAAYRVGVGKLADAYAATRRAVEACGEWPAVVMAGRKVVIKPNLVVGMTAETGVTTDPQVVRALVDLALEAEAAQVLIVEDGPHGAKFSACGYDFFDDYDLDGRVSLVDLADEPVVLTAVPGGIGHGGRRTQPGGRGPGLPVGHGASAARRAAPHVRHPQGAGPNLYERYRGVG